MDSVCRGLDFIFVYLDDILVASSSESQHLEDLRALFDRLKEHGLVLNPAKCEFCVSQIDFLGHQIINDGAMPLPAKGVRYSILPSFFPSKVYKSSLVW